MDKVRVDKWLWSVRIFKSRTMAANACKNGKVRLNGTTPLKASSSIKKGELLHVRKNNFNLIFKVVELIEKRVSAKLAEPCYENLTPAEEMNKFKSWFVTNAPGEYREKGAGRPTKKERREIDDFKEMDLKEELEDFFNFEEE